MLSLEAQNQWRERYRITRPGWHPATEVYAGRVREHLRSGARLLDLGCGRGGLVEQLSNVAIRPVGVDPDFVSLRKHRLGDLPRAAATSDRLPFMNGSFDVVAASWLLEHLADPRATFQAVGRVLRPGGVFIFVTPNGRNPLGWVNRFTGRLGQVQGRLVKLLYGRAENDTFPTAYRANSPQDLSCLITGAGLVLETMDLVADPTYLAFNEWAFRATSALDDWLPANRRIHIVGVVRKTAPVQV